MQRPKPMDRLICGDVGYGKTEVAMRGALSRRARRATGRRARADDGAGAAALQYLPPALRALSRARRDAVAVPLQRRRFKAVVRGVASGEVDIVIGTHRLLQKDIVFKNLGLLIVDEEHRFGVAHKERIKQMRKLVDVPDADRDADSAHLADVAARHPRSERHRDAADRPPGDPHLRDALR